MACGLGAVILLFLIVKHNTGSGVEAATQESSSTSDMQLLATLNQNKKSLEQQIQDETQKKESVLELMKLQEIDQSKREVAQKELDQLRLRIQREEARKQSLENQIMAIQPAKVDDVVENPARGEEQYLIGMKVEGRNVVILLDRSSSMTDQRLIDVISRKIEPDAIKQKGPKWMRAKRTVNWLLQRLPKQSQFAVIAFNKEAKLLNDGRWANSRNANDVRNIMNEIDALIPTGATNLEAALKTLRKLTPKPTNLYIVTDGLPTIASESGSIFSGCRLSKNTVSGECRRQIFRKNALDSRRSNSKLITNVILLPLEGDPEAAPEYWSWTAKTGGNLLVPDVGWP